MMHRPLHLPAQPAPGTRCPADSVAGDYVQLCLSPADAAHVVGLLNADLRAGRAWSAICDAGLEDTARIMQLTVLKDRLTLALDVLRDDAAGGKRK